MGMDYTYIKCAQKGELFELILNRSEKSNALNLQFIREITECLGDIEKDETIRIVVLRGEGKNFCAGADLEWMSKAAQLNYDANYSESLELADLFSEIFNSNKLFIALVQGACYGGGVGLAAVCDFIIAEHSAVFSLSEVRLGLVAATISPYIIYRIGVQRAKSLILTGEPKSATQMEQYGFVDTIVGEKEAENELASLIHLLLQGGNQAQQKIKSLFNRGFHHENKTSLREKTAEIIAESRVSPEGMEGIRAFLEKRKPEWK